MRSLLFVPADSPRKLARAAASDADALIVDLEDSVAADAKEAARTAAADFVAGAAGRTGRQSLIVRVNALSSGLAEADLAAVMGARPDGIMLPKCTGAGDAARCAAAIAGHERAEGIAEGATKLIVIATETAGSLFAMGDYAAVGARLSGLTWGAEDLGADLGAAAARGEDGRYTGPFALARTLALVAARAAGAEPIDGVYTDFRDLDGLAREAREAARDGFTAKLAIHPDQIGPINAAFTPAPDEVARARAVLAAFAAAGGSGVVAIDGVMYDRPHELRARRLIARAERASARGLR
jgi:citrate lyase subunit beta/citryl-CoA lyase